MAWTTDDLLASVRRSGYLPDAHDLADADLLAWADEELATTFAALIRSAREEYRVKREDIPLVPGTLRYRMPRRALAGTVRGVTCVDASGGERPAQEVPALEAWRYGANGGGAALYMYEGDEIVMASPVTSAGASLRVRYVDRMPRLVPTSEARSITYAADTTTLVLETEAPDTLGTEGALVDIVRGDSPFPSLYTDLVVLRGVTGVLIDQDDDPILDEDGDPIDGMDETRLLLDDSTPVATSAISTSGAPGVRVDWVCPRDCTVFPPIPQELHGPLALAVVRRVLEALADPRVGVVEATLTQRLTRATSIIESRDQNKQPRIIDHGSRLRSGRGRGGR